MNKIMIVGEAYGEKEEEVGQSLVGTAGWILNNMLSQLGIARKECFVTDVFNFRPKPSGDVSNLCGAKADGIPGYPALVKGKYLDASHNNSLERLYSEIVREEPNVIVALGGTAAWALLQSSGIRAIRGTTTPTHPYISRRLGRDYKVLPTYHPSAISRDWSLRPIALSDLNKAKAEAEFPDVRRPSRSIWIKPTLGDLYEFEQSHILPASQLSIDIETAGDQITCIGFAPSDSISCVIPFHSNERSDGNYWPTLEEELIAWEYVRRWCKAKPALFQNGLYDIHFLWRRYGITVPLASQDTMLLHHSLQPEMEKGLGFLASIYTQEASWKFMRTKHQTLKRED